MSHATPRLFASALVVGCLVLAGCLGGTPDPDAGPEPAPGLVRVQDRHLLPFVTDQAWSLTLESGLFDILPGKGFFFDVPVPLGRGLPMQQGHLGLFLPDIPGCDWDATELPEECRVPVIADIGPYYGQLLYDPVATEPAGRLGRFLIENFVPHGYAVAQVSVMGTGESGGCMDLMGRIEQAGVQASVDWLGTQAWSNGAVGLIGRSYDGSTPWEAAMNGSPHLKTVVPISGLYGQHDLMWKNGTAETRGPGVLWALYYSFTYTQSHDDEMGRGQQIVENAVCPDTQTGAAHAVSAYLTGNKGPEAVAYWHERSFKQEVLDNYQGSVYFIHGLQDWNVDPHMAFPFYQELKDKGLDIKGLFGQWGHHYPDRIGEHSGMRAGYGKEAVPASVRYDWAQDLLEWFDHYLKGTGPKPQLHVEVQENHGAWRIEETYPPLDATWREISLADATFIGATGGQPLLTAMNQLVFDLGVIDGERDTLIAGMPRFHPTVTPTGPHGQLFVELRDKTANLRLGHATMDLRYHAGGDELQVLVPGMPIVAKMEFFAMDVVVPAGHELRLVVTQFGEDYLPVPGASPVLIDTSASSVLKLPLVERGEDAYFTPPR